MTIKKIIRNSWKLVREHGDIEKIVESTISDEKPNGISRVTIGHALRTGQMNETTFEAINSFYKPRIEKMQKSENEAKKHVHETEND